VRLNKSVLQEDSTGEMEASLDTEVFYHLRLLRGNEAIDIKAQRPLRLNLNR